MNRLLFSGVLALAVPATALACRCRPPTQDQAFAHAKAVVVGRIDAVRDLDRARTVLGVTVARAWKRAISGTIEVDTGTTCRLPARVGEQYLLFLRSDGAGRYFTTHCMGDRLDPPPSVLDEIKHLDADAPRRAWKTGER